MKVRIRNALDFVKYSELELELPTKSPFKEVIQKLNEELKPKAKKIRYTITKGNEQIRITDFTKSLDDFNFKEIDSLQLEEETSLEIPTYWVIIISYIGAPLMFTLYLLTTQHLDYVKILATFLTYAHYFRRIYESIFIFKTGRATLPVISPDFIGVCLYYWIAYGILVGHYIFKEEFDTNLSFFETAKMGVLVILFLYCEFQNSKCHVYLANLKENNNGQRAVPRGGMFNYVTCAHYFWELMTWVAFCLLTNVWTSYLWVAFSFVSMAFLALDRHKSNKKFFGDRYPSNMKAFIPFLI